MRNNILFEEYFASEISLKKISNVDNNIDLFLGKSNVGRCRIFDERIWSHSESCREQLVICTIFLSTDAIFSGMLTLSATAQPPLLYGVRWVGIFSEFSTNFRRSFSGFSAFGICRIPSKISAEFQKNKHYEFVWRGSR